VEIFTQTWQPWHSKMHVDFPFRTKNY